MRRGALAKRGGEAMPPRKRHGAAVWALPLTPAETQQKRKSPRRWDPKACDTSLPSLPITQVGLRMAVDSGGDSHGAADGVSGYTR